jgi:hypothetical protein
MTVVNLKVLAELDWGMVVFMLPMLLGAAMLMLLAWAWTRAEMAPRVEMTPLPATLPPAPPAMPWHRRPIPRACSVYRAPPDLPQPKLASRIRRIAAPC